MAQTKSFTFPAVPEFPLEHSVLPHNPPPPPLSNPPSLFSFAPAPTASFDSTISAPSPRSPHAQPSATSAPHMALYPQPGRPSDSQPNPNTSFNSFSQPNGRPSTSASAQHNLEPPMQPAQIYSAVYSGIPVYEMEVNKIAVMRRREDSWLNATQILKVANIPKAKRTKILEKEILTGVHEKIQGGYGKYQGTWVSYQRGVDFCRQYGVEKFLRPLLEHDMGRDGLTVAGQGGVETPTKEQAMAAQRKRLYNPNINGARPNGQASDGTFFSNISATASNAVAAISKARLGQRPNNAKRTLAPNSQDMSFLGGSQQSMRSVASDSSFGGAADSTYGSNQPSHPLLEGDSQEPPRKKMRMVSEQDAMQIDDAVYDPTQRDTTPTEPSQSFLYKSTREMLDQENGGVMPLPPLPEPSTKLAEEKQKLLVSLFLDPSQTDFSNHKAFLTLSGDDFDTPLDSAAHTALHWASTLAKIPLVKILIERGASIYRVNTGGETALDKACVVTNNYDNASFPELLELLGPTIRIPDARGRTILHKIALSCAVKGRMLASKYYLESLLEFVVRQGSAPSSQANSFSLQQTSSTLAHPSHRPISLASFIHDIVNAQDKSGDTALNVAARAGSRSIIQQLLEVRADPNIPNRVGLRPKDFGIGAGDGTDNTPPEYETNVDDGTMNRIVGETSRDIVSSISSLLTETSKEFSAELRTKQTLIDGTHTELREASTRLGDERRKLDALRAAAIDRSQLKQKILNLRQAMTEQRDRTAPFHTRINGAYSEPAGTLPNDAVRSVGDADVGLAPRIDPAALPSPAAPATDSSPAPLSMEQQAYLSSLPDTATLQAQARAYAKVNESLRQRVQALRNRSAELEGTYRRIVSLCTGKPEKAVDRDIGKLLVAMESESATELDPGRAREFVRLVSELGP